MADKTGLELLAELIRRDKGVNTLKSNVKDIAAPTTGTATEALTRLLPFAGDAWGIDDAKTEYDAGNTKTAAAMGALNAIGLGGLGGMIKRVGRTYSDKELDKLFKSAQKVLPDDRSFEGVLRLFSDDAIEEARGNGWKGKTRGVVMPVQTFQDMAAPIYEYDTEKLARIMDAIASKEKLSEIPYLNLVTEDMDPMLKMGIDPQYLASTANVVGHEGRHRSKIFTDLGFQDIPVGLKADFRWGMQQEPNFDYMEVWPDLMRGQDEHASNIISFPVSRADAGKADFKAGGLASLR